MAQSTCTVCGSDFESRHPRRYCSPRCKNLGGARLRKVRNSNRPTRTCYRCRQVIPAAGFPSATSTYCRPCGNEVQREWRSANPALVRKLKQRSIAKAAVADPDYYRKLTLRKYGLSLSSYEALLSAQGDRCAICRATEPGGRHGTWHVDHDRSCCPKMWSCGNCVRGLLCQNCNLLLGHAKDDPVILELAAAYLANRSKH